jgi:hypothetical protein
MAFLANSDKKAHIIKETERIFAEMFPVLTKANTTFQSSNDTLKGKLNY